jgi:hypothetical protein
MLRKYFPFDKNYILKEAQLQLESELLLHLVEACKQTYLIRCNPLGLIDTSIEKILAHKGRDFSLLQEFYYDLAAIYRYQYGDNQLELLFDGTDHFTKFSNDWREAFRHWLHQFLKSEHFLKAILEATVFYPADRKAHLAANRLKSYYAQHFDLKVYKHRGIMRVA